jgi:hypothetical protein
MMRTAALGRGPVIALSAMLASGATAGYSFWRAMVVEPVYAPTDGIGVVPIPSPVRLAVADPDGLEVAIDQDPFRPERRRPPERFPLPDDPVPDPAPVLAAPDPGAVRLIGTVVMPEGRSFAMCQVAGEPPKLVRLGETVGDLTLRRVDQGLAVFITAGGATVEARVPKAGT